MAIAFLRESQQTRELWFKSQRWQGTRSPPLLLLLPDCMFTARLMKFGHGACFLSAPNLQWYWHSALAVPLCCCYPPPLPVLFLLDQFRQMSFFVKSECPQKQYSHSCPLPPPVKPSLHVSIQCLCLSTVPLPIYNVAGCAVVSCEADHACVA